MVQRDFPGASDRPVAARRRTQNRPPFGSPSSPVAVTFGLAPRTRTTSARFPTRTARRTGKQRFAENPPGVRRRRLFDRFSGGRSPTSLAAVRIRRSRGRHVVRPIRVAPARRAKLLGLGSVRFPLVHDVAVEARDDGNDEAAATPMRACVSRDCARRRFARRAPRRVRVVRERGLARSSSSPLATSALGSDVRALLPPPSARFGCFDCLLLVRYAAAGVAVPFGAVPGST